jgi:hypothetical protein
MITPEQFKELDKPNQEAIRDFESAFNKLIDMGMQAEFYFSKGNLCMRLFLKNKTGYRGIRVYSVKNNHIIQSDAE